MRLVMLAFAVFLVPGLATCQEPPVVRWPDSPVLLVPVNIAPAARQFLAAEWDSYEKQLDEHERAYCGAAVRDGRELSIVSVRRMEAQSTPWSVRPEKFCASNEVPIHTHPRNTCEGTWTAESYEYTLEYCEVGGARANLCFNSIKDQSYQPGSDFDVSGVQCDRNAVVFYRALLPTDLSRFVKVDSLTTTVQPPKKSWWRRLLRL